MYVSCLNEPMSLCIQNIYRRYALMSFYNDILVQKNWAEKFNPSLYNITIQCIIISKKILFYTTHIFYYTHIPTYSFTFNQRSIDSRYATKSLIFAGKPSRKFTNGSEPRTLATRYHGNNNSFRTMDLLF